MAAKRIRKSKPVEEHAAHNEVAPRLVYVQAPVQLGKLVERTERGWTVDLGTVVRELAVDDSVDAALLAEAHESGARVIVDASGTPTIVGVVATRRAVTVDREGRVDAKVKSFEVSAEEEVLFKIPGAFVRAKSREVEVYGERVITRARNLAKILAAMIKLN